MTLIDTAKIGKKGGDARAANLSADARSKSAGEASRARWAAYYKLHPDKLRAKLQREKEAAKQKTPTKKKAAK